MFQQNFCNALGLLSFFPVVIRGSLHSPVPTVATRLARPAVRAACLLRKAEQELSYVHRLAGGR